METFVARQPVFNSQKKVFGYDLSFRDGFENIIPPIDSDIEASNVLANTFFSFQMPEVLRNKPGFVNFTKPLLQQNIATIFPKENIIIKVLNDIDQDVETFASLRALKKKGYKIAMDDFSLNRDAQMMINFSNIVKIDFKSMAKNKIYHTVKALDATRDVTFLAQNLQTYKDFDFAKDTGFKLFQGDFFSRPEQLSKKDISINKVSRLKLIDEIRKPDMDTENIEAIIKKDVSISYKLLKFLNSAYFRRPYPINTIKDGITYLGTDELKKFITLIVVSDLGPNKPNELTRLSVVRARMCEKIGALVRMEFTSDELFTLGLFSLLDALLDSRMEEIVNTIGLSNKMQDALLGKVRNFNTILALVKSIEKGEWHRMIFKAIAGRSIESRLPVFYFDALKLSNTLAFSR